MTGKDMRQRSGDADRGGAGMSRMCTAADKREGSFERNGIAHLTTKYPHLDEVDKPLVINCRR